MKSSSKITRGNLFRQGRIAADELLGRLGVRAVSKAFDLSSPDGFDQAVASLSSKLRATANVFEEESVKAAIGSLDVDWHGTTPAQRRRLIHGVMNDARVALGGIPRSVETVLGPSADEVVRATRSSLRARHNLPLRAELNAVDDRLVRYLKTSQSGFITDELGRRISAAEVGVTRAVAESLEKGLGRRETADRLRSTLSAQLVGRSPFYWETVAGAFISQGRSFSQLSGYAEAGISKYVFEAVLDEATTETCRFLHGKVFSVQSGLETFKKLEATPQAQKTLLPWVRSQKKDGAHTLFIDRGDERTILAEVESPGFGEVDRVGTYRNSLSADELSSLNVSLPPLHGLCRSTTVPRFA